MSNGVTRNDIPPAANRVRAYDGCRGSGLASDLPSDGAKVHTFGRAFRLECGQLVQDTQFCSCAVPGNPKTAEKVNERTSHNIYCTSIYAMFVPRLQADIGIAFK